MIYLKRLILMIQFLTIIPLPVKLDVDQKDFGKGLVFAPAVGSILGGIMAGCFYASGLVFPVYVSAVLTMVIYIILTGGLHLDGLGDTFDGLFSNRSKERILEILRDSRVGTNAVLAVVSVLLIDIAVISALSNTLFPIKVILLMPVAGRIGSLIGSGVSTYARSGEGLGKSFIDYCGVEEVIAGGFIYIAVFFLVAGQMGLILSIFPIITAYILIKFFCSKIGGATGDILGAVCELNQMLFIIAAYVFLK